MKTVSDSTLIEDLRKGLDAGESTDRRLRKGGLVHIERRLPFLLVHRRGDEADLSIESLVRSHPAYAALRSTTGRARLDVKLVRSIVEVLARPFEAFMLLEIWAGSDVPTVVGDDLRAGFHVHALQGTTNDGVLDALENELRAVKLSKRRARVRTSTDVRWAPPGMNPLMTSELASALNVQCYGLEVARIYQDESSGKVFPAVLRKLRHELTRGLRKALYRFTVDCTRRRPAHFHSLGRNAVGKAVWESDRRIAAVCDRFDFLLSVTPVNGAEAWQDFRRSRRLRAPALHYPPIPADPVALKRELYKAPVERVIDPALSLLFREKIEEVDRQITMLQDRNTPEFLPESVQLYGGVDDDLRATARDILERVRPGAHRSDSSDQVDAAFFAERARSELAYLRKQHPELQADVELRSDVASLMVSRGKLLVGSDWTVSRGRVEALIQHEIGTHVVTYANGRAQPFRQLYVGLAGYEALQEGLAVTAEYLVGGLNSARLRTLAARVVAVRSMQDGEGFPATFHLLHEEYGVPARTAFNITLRIYRGGGLTKDALYLAGLQQLLAYLANDGELDDLFVGKIAARHMDVVQELRWRGVLRPPPLKPRYLQEKLPLERLAALRERRSPIQLIERKRR